MWLLVAREPPPDAPYWPGRRLLASVDAAVWPFLWVLVFSHAPKPAGLVGPFVAAVALLFALSRLHRAFCIGVVDHEIADTPPRGVRCIVQTHHAARVLSARSVRNGGPRFAPSIKVRAAPRDRPRAESNRAWELLVGDQAVDRRTPEAGHTHDRRHAQEHRRRGVGTG